ncbi:hypothetical protein FHP25_05735 [Vineibacter terrae]|uniref:Uncharacterized protein n=1 Tax=Vineibacter terrae TaxID=2586908 RepID=A0A5C8PSF6_9HYPH|nr:hypothetical protein [Vineibacter terrae]TXL79452.1 hypothetical protein FHP25_05735 [Vineibacter terrae]
MMDLRFPQYGIPGGRGQSGSAAAAGADGSDDAGTSELDRQRDISSEAELWAETQQQIRLAIIQSLLSSDRIGI